MASVIAAQAVKTRVLSDGRVRATFRYDVIDNPGNQIAIFEGPLTRPPGWIPGNESTAYAAAFLDALAKSEEQEFINSIDRIDVLHLAQNPVWTTTKRIVKTVIYYMMREKNPRIVIYLEPIILHLRANYNATQLSDFLDISQAKLAKMNDRINAILDTPSPCISPRDSVAIFDGVQDELTP